MNAIKTKEKESTAGFIHKSVLTHQFFSNAKWSQGSIQARYKANVDCPVWDWLEESSSSNSRLSMQMAISESAELGSLFPFSLCILQWSRSSPNLYTFLSTTRTFLKILFHLFFLFFILSLFCIKISKLFNFVNDDLFKTLSRYGKWKSGISQPEKIQYFEIRNGLCILLWLQILRSRSKISTQHWNEWFDDDFLKYLFWLESTVSVMQSESSSTHD